MLFVRKTVTAGPKLQGMTRTTASTRTGGSRAHRPVGAPARAAVRRRPRRPSSLAISLAALLASTSAAVLAADATLEARITQLVRASVADDSRVEVEIGQIDSRTRLAPCPRLEPYVPAGTRLWGRTAIGLRCMEGANWSVSVPIQVRVFGQALVTTTALAAGASVGESDVRLAEVDLTRAGRQLVSDPAQLANRVLAGPIAAGQPLRAEQLRMVQAVAAGDPVRIRLLGRGFEIAASGVALSGAGEGQAVRVRTDNGRVLSGTARGRTVEVEM